MGGQWEGMGWPYLVCLARNSIIIECACQWLSPTTASHFPAITLGSLCYPMVVSKPGDSHLASCPRDCARDWETTAICHFLKISLNDRISTKNINIIYKFEVIIIPCRMVFSSVTLRSTGHDMDAEPTPLLSGAF